ncbi:MAG: segregation/condensation protein A [Thermoguttaceae bacterium]|jgi:segregation and condensation protein A|nr:segregation/condensation protein A [Thermoguttaceae bacterium]
MDFRVDLQELFRGPLDLLYYLVRKHEVEVEEVPLAKIAEQYLEYLAVLKEIDVDAVGDFLVVASTLMEIKSQRILPHADEVDETVEDPREDLVRRLLEYKKYRDAASVLEERSRRWQQQYARRSSDLPPRERDLAEEPIHEVELWDLVSAFGRVLRSAELVRPSNIVYDDTPIHVYMTRIQARLDELGRLAFSGLFDPSMHKSRLVGIFLAVLELVRHHQVSLEQHATFGEIWIYPRPDAGGPLDVSAVDNYDHTPATTNPA